MGKVLSRFKFLGSSTSKHNTYAVDSSCAFDDNICTNYTHTNMTNKSVVKIHEVNNFQEFDNVLNISCNPNTSICMFGQADYVSRNKFQKSII